MNQSVVRHKNMINDKNEDIIDFKEFKKNKNFPNIE